MPMADAPKKADQTELCVWQSIREVAEEHVTGQPVLASFLHATILNHDRFEDAVSFHLAGKLSNSSLSAMQLREIMDSALQNDSGVSDAIKADIFAVRERDPAVSCCLVPLLYLKGVHGLASYRIAHYLWNEGQKLLALHLQNRISETFGIDIHPAARIGKGILMDHGTSIVIGETAVVDDNVSMLHEVTLGGDRQGLRRSSSQGPPECTHRSRCEDPW